MLPFANAAMMNLHVEPRGPPDLAEISHQVALDAHAVVVLDGADWHQLGGALSVPDNLTLLHLPPYSPELNPVGNVWEQRFTPLVFPPRTIAA